MIMGTPKEKQENPVDTPDNPREQKKNDRGSIEPAQKDQQQDDTYLTEKESANAKNDAKGEIGSGQTQDSN